MGDPRSTVLDTKAVNRDFLWLGQTGVSASSMLDARPLMLVKEKRIAINSLASVDNERFLGSAMARLGTLWL